MTTKMRIYPSPTTNLDQQHSFLNQTITTEDNSVGNVLGWYEWNLTDLWSWKDEQHQRVLDLTTGGVDFETPNKTRHFLGVENSEVHFVGCTRSGFRIETENLFVQFITGTECFPRELHRVRELLKYPPKIWSLNSLSDQKRPSFSLMNEHSTGRSFVGEDIRNWYVLEFDQFTDDLKVITQEDRERRHNHNYSDPEVRRFNERYDSKTSLYVRMRPHRVGTEFFGTNWKESISDIISDTGTYTLDMVCEDLKPLDHLKSFRKDLIDCLMTPTDNNVSVENSVERETFLESLGGVQ